MRLNFFDIISLLGISQGLLLAFLLSKKHSANHTANRWLVLLLLLSCILLASRLVLIGTLDLALFQRLSIVEPIIFLYGPLSYHYTRALLQANRSPSKVWRNYGLAMAYFLFVGYLNILPLQTFREQWVKGLFLIPFSLIELFALAQNMYYWVITKQFLSTYHETSKHQISYDQGALKFVGISHKSIGVILLFWLIGFVCSNVLGLQNVLFGYNAVWIALSLLIYLIAYFALTQPEIFKVHLLHNSKTHSKNHPRLQENEIAQLKRNLDTLMNQQKVFTDNKLTLSILAQHLNTSTNNLSWLLNKVYRTNFYDFINERRIDEFIRKVKNQEHTNQTLLALSLEVGFNSKSTFNKVFKSLKHDTPSNFIKKLPI